MKGNFRIWLPQRLQVELQTRLIPVPLVATWFGLICAPEPDIIMPNRVTDEGEEEYLKMLFRDVTEIAGGANFYIGLCNQVPAEADLLPGITTEPGAAGGYARKAVARSAAGFPTITVVNGHKVIRTATQTFTASGADFDTAFTRAFLTDQSSGTAGKLYAYSGALTTALTLLDGEAYAFQYETYID